MRVLLAFLRRDALIWSSYRTAVLWQFLGVAILSTLVYFVGTPLGSNPGLIDSQGGSYLAFVLSGIAFTDFFSQGIYAVSAAISDNQKAGTLEPTLLTPIGDLQLVVASALFKMLLAAMRMIAYLAFGAFALGYWHDANLASAVLILLPASLVFVSIGMLSAAFVIVVKQGDPVLLVYAWATGLIGGVLFPVKALPEWVQPLSVFIPLTHALNGMRGALDGVPPAGVLGSCLVLLAIGAVLLPLGIVAFGQSIRRAKQEGSLAQY